MVEHLFHDYIESLALSCHSNNITRRATSTVYRIHLLNLFYSPPPPPRCNLGSGFDQLAQFCIVDNAKLELYAKVFAVKDVDEDGILNEEVRDALGNEGLSRNPVTLCRWS